ncbi:MAG: insulinase family protein, partial [archaeon]|nr:insulinase family protein [archaeon]
MEIKKINKIHQKKASRPDSQKRGFRLGPKRCLEEKSLFFLFLVNDMMAARSMSTLLGASRRLFATSSSGKAFEYLSNRPPTKVTTLNNGLKVATEPAFGETASLGVYINAGSAYETAANNGVAHFLEHLIFVRQKKTNFSLSL